MMLIEQTTVPNAALPVQEFKQHLRLGTGFADDDLQDGVLESFLRAALAAVEARTGKAVIVRDFRWELTAWRDLSRQVLPIAPVSAISGLVITDQQGVDEVIDPSRYRLEPDMHRPKLVASGLVLPVIPVGGMAAISFTAGFGASWGAVPADLAQAVMLLAARFYEQRGLVGEAAIPASVESLLARFRVIRLFGGGVS
ncbi:MAG: hypothetical protein P8X50_15095 [Maritimibacter sp.]